VVKLRSRLAADGIFPADPPRHDSGSIVPHRLTRGPIHGGYVTDRLDSDRRVRYEADGERIGGIRYEIVNYINGRRTALEIRNRVTAHYGPTRLDDVVAYIEDLEAAGVVEVKR
jgi:hypothetical protein